MHGRWTKSDGVETKRSSFVISASFLTFASRLGRVNHVEAVFSSHIIALHQNLKLETKV
jgi:hypothetical protein